MGDGIDLILEVRVPPQLPRSLAGDPQAWESPLLRSAELGTARAAFLSSQNDAAHDLFSHGFFRNTGEDTMSDDTLYDDAAEEVVKNTILNASVMKLDTDILPSSSQPTEADRKDD